MGGIDQETGILIVEPFRLVISGTCLETPENPCAIEFS